MFIISSLTSRKLSGDLQIKLISYQMTYHQFIFHMTAKRFFVLFSVFHKFSQNRNAHEIFLTSKGNWTHSILEKLLICRNTSYYNSSSLSCFSDFDGFMLGWFFSPLWIIKKQFKKMKKNQELSYLLTV